MAAESQTEVAVVRPWISGVTGAPSCGRKTLDVLRRVNLEGYCSNDRLRRLAEWARLACRGTLPDGRGAQEANACDHNWAHGIKVRI